MSTKVKLRKGPTSVSVSSTDHLQQQSNHEEIVMTPLKAKVGQIIRVERVSSGALDGKKAHYFAEGPYKGIVVNKATNVRPYKTAPDTMRRFIAYVHDQGETAKEVREIRFWFQKDMERDSMEEHSEQFFRELITPTDFPKDHLKFVKRVLTLAQSYSVLRFLELEMRPYTSKDDPFDVRGQPFSTEDRPKLRKAISTMEQPVRQVASTDDLRGSQGHGRRRLRRLTVSGMEKLRDTTGAAVPTVFVYNPGDPDAVEKGGKKKVKAGGTELVRSEAVENLNDWSYTQTEDSVFGVNGETSPNIGAASETKVTRKSGPPPTGSRGNPSYKAESTANDYPMPIYGVVKKNRKSTENESTPSPLTREPASLTQTPNRPPSGRYDAVDGQVAPPVPSSVNKRRSSKRPKSSSELTSRAPGASTPSRNSYPESKGLDSTPGDAKQNGRPPSSARRKIRSESEALRKSKVVALLEDAFPTMLSVDELTRMSRTKAEEVEMELERLSAAGVAAEVDSGMWVRAQVQRRLAPSTSSKKNRTSAQDLKKNEFRMVASTPSLSAEDQPTIAIITSQYCEKMAVDAMMDVKTTYVRYKTQGEGLVYTVGLIERHRVVSTKLSRVGHGSESRLSAERTVPRLLETFGQVEHILLVGVGGGVANFEEDSKHIRLGDVVVSNSTDRVNHFLYFHVTGNDVDDSSSITLETRPWASEDSELRSVVAKMEKSSRKKLWKQMDALLEEASQELAAAGETSFTRPPPDSDQLYRKTEKTKTLVGHPDVTAGSIRDQRAGHPLVHYGAVASGKILSRDDGVRSQFCLQQNVKAVDSGIHQVLDSLEDRSELSFTIIRGVSDYGDGTKNKEWQPYAALAAAAVMKCIVMRLSLPEDDVGLV